MSSVRKSLIEQGVQQVDLKFTDLFGRWQHTTVPINSFSEANFTEGIGFDGSSLRGWMAINESDMQLRADPDTFCLDPFSSLKTGSYLCNIYDPITKSQFSRDPRYVAIKGVEYLKSSGIADVAYFGPEAEFYLFHDVRYRLNPNDSFFSVDSAEAAWNTGRSEEGGNLAYKYGDKGGYFPAAPFDQQWDVRASIATHLEQMGIPVEVHHHEVGAPGQGEVGIKYSDMVHMADRLMWFLYTVRNVARMHQLAATFMPKPLFGEAGSGMHVHVSLWKNGENLFAGDKYSGLSTLALHFIGGILKHTHSLLAFTNPTTNSYKRLVPGYEAPVNLTYSGRNRSAAIRIPAYASTPHSKRIEFRVPDATCNPYLAFTAILLAGLDGIENEIDPGDAIDKNIYKLPPEIYDSIPKAPQSLEEALSALEQDHDYLIKGDVFTEDLLQTWLNHKYKIDVELSRLHPTPLEYQLYFNG